MSREEVVNFGRVQVAYHLIRAKRKTMEIAVHPDGRVVVKAPLMAESAKVAAKVKKRAAWILRQQNYFSQFHPRTPARRYCSGETHFFLGRKYRLKVLKNGKKEVTVGRGTLQITSDGSASRDKVKGLMIGWYRVSAREVFNEVLESAWKHFGNRNLKRPAIQIKRMTRRWGSLTPSGVLTLNLDLIRAPKDCIEYVVTHELCHLLYQDHGLSFYNLLEEIMPDWQKRKHRLELTLI